MLVIISDLHLTDGTSGETISAGAFRIFRQRLSDMAYDASWRDDGRYKPIEVLDLILLGDIFDPIRSSQWIFDDTGRFSEDRPWDDPQTPSFINQVRRITKAILSHNKETLTIFKDFSQGKVTIPPAMANGKPAEVSWDPRDSRRVPVDIRIHYLVGNHDWFYHLPGAAYNEIRREIVETMGLANSPDEPFPHEPSEAPALQELYRSHRLFARHGDIYDPANYEGNRDASSLGDAVVVELLNRFPAEVKALLGDDLPVATRDGLQELDNVRPMLVIPIWINGLLRRTCRDGAVIQKVKDVWDQLADEFLSLKFVRQRDSALNFFDDVDTLEWALKFSRGVSLQTISEVAQWAKAKFGRGDGSYYKTAIQEEAFLRKYANYIVHGHTHLREVTPLDSTLIQGARYDQIYLNSGTWRRVHELARFNLQEQEFIGYHEMTYFAFYQGDERKGRPFEVWSGTLGVS